MEFILGIIIGLSISFILTSWWVVDIYKEGIIFGEISKELDTLHKKYEEIIKNELNN